MRKFLRPLFFLLFFLTIAYLFQKFFGHEISFENLKNQQLILQNEISQNFLAYASLYFFFYICIAAFALPGAAVFTLAGGAFFGLIPGLFLASFASSLGALFAFLLSRLVLGQWVEQKFSAAAKQINRGIETAGTSYLFFLRLTPIFPFFLVNVLMGLTRFPLFRFYWVSQIAMLPATFLFVNAGTQLSQLRSPSDVFSPAILLSFTALGLFPLLLQLLTKKIWKQKKWQT